MKNRIAGLLVIIILIIGCNNHNKIDQGITTSNEISISKIEENTNLNRQDDQIELMQGLWESIPDLIEHKFGNRDLNLNKYFKIVFNNKVLDVVIKWHDTDSIKLESSIVGFLDAENKESLATTKYTINDIKPYGKYLIYILENNINENNVIQVDTSKVSNVYSIDKSGYGDNLKYGGNKSDIHTTTESSYDENGFENIGFQRINTIPLDVFVKLEKLSNEHNRNYVKEYNVFEYSGKVKVLSSKTFFYTEMSEASKRKAFLVKGDIAYLENLDKDWAKIYYDGKTISRGYVKVNDIEVIEK